MSSALEFLKNNKGKLIGSAGVIGAGSLLLDGKDDWADITNTFKVTPKQLKKLKNLVDINNIPIPELKSMLQEQIDKTKLDRSGEILSGALLNIHIKDPIEDFINTKMVSPARDLEELLRQN